MPALLADSDPETRAHARRLTAWLRSHAACPARERLVKAARSERERAAVTRALRAVAKTPDLLPRMVANLHAVAPCQASACLSALRAVDAVPGAS